MKYKSLVILFALIILCIPIRAYAGQLSGRTIILDPGHGQNSSPRYGAYIEHVAMLGLALEMRTILEYHGARVILTRDSFDYVHLAVRAAIINIASLEALLNEHTDDIVTAEINRLIGIMQRIIRNPAVYAPIYFNYPFDWDNQTTIHPDLYRIFMWQARREVSHNFLMISLHSNASDNPYVNGADVFHSTNYHPNGRTYFAGRTTYIKTGIFGNYLLRYISAIGIRGNRTRAGNFFVIRENNIPSVLVENGYHTNPRDRALLMCSIFMSNLAHAYVDAIISYFNAIDPRNIPTLSRLQGIINRLTFPHPGFLYKQHIIY